MIMIRPESLNKAGDGTNRGRFSENLVLHDTTALHLDYWPSVCNAFEIKIGLK